MARTVRPRVFVTRQLPGEAPGRPGRHVELHVWEDEPPPSRDARRAEAAHAEGLVTLLTDRGDAALLAGAPGPRAVGNMAMSDDDIDVRACTARGIPVGNTPGVLTGTTADFALAHLMAPHLASASHAPRGRRASMAVDNLLAALEGRRPPHCVNPELFP